MKSILRNGAEPQTECRHTPCTIAQFAPKPVGRRLPAPRRGSRLVFDLAVRQSRLEFGDARVGDSLCSVFRPPGALRCDTANRCRRVQSGVRPMASGQPAASTAPVNRRGAVAVGRPPVAGLPAGVIVGAPRPLRIGVTSENRPPGDKSVDSQHSGSFVGLALD